MIQVDIYRLDRRLQSSFETDASTLCAKLNSWADRPFDTLAHYVMGEVSVLRVDLGRNGFAVLEHVG